MVHHKNKFLESSFKDDEQNQEEDNFEMKEFKSLNDEDNSLMSKEETLKEEEVHDVANDDQQDLQKVSHQDEEIASSEEQVKEQDQKLESEKKKTPQKVTPLPWGKLFVVFFIYLCDSLSYTSLMPYITFMISDFNLTENPTEYGYYVGLVASAYFLSQFISSFFWGTISDSIGRKPVLLFGTFFGAICGLMFGFSKWLWWACACRFMFGLLNGNLGVVKSYLGEITDSTNQARAFSLTSITFGLASVLGPVLGGLFSRPHQQYPEFVLLFPEWIQNFVIQFPYVLPSFFIFCFYMVAFVLGCLKLEEANKNTWYYRRFISKEHLEKETTKEKKLEKESNDLEEQEQEPVIVKETFFQKFKNKFNSFKSHEMLSSPIPLLTCFLYLMLGSKQILFDECMPLFSVTPKELGGLGLSSYHLGLTGGFLGFVIFMNQLFITPRVIAKFSPLTCYRISLVVDTAFNIMFPEVIWLMVSDHDPVWRHVLFWFVFVLILLLRQVSNGYSFLGTLLITNNSVTRKNSGKLNGTSQSLVSLSRMISPVVGGAIFASSTAVSKFPIDHRTVFYVVTVISVIMFFLSLLLKKSINKPKEEIKAEESNKK